MPGAHRVVRSRAFSENDVNNTELSAQKLREALNGREKELKKAAQLGQQLLGKLNDKDTVIAELQGQLQAEQRKNNELEMAVKNTTGKLQEAIRDANYWKTVTTNLLADTQEQTGPTPPTSPECILKAYKAARSKADVEEKIQEVEGLECDLLSEQAKAKQLELELEKYNSIEVKLEDIEEQRGLLSQQVQTYKVQIQQLKSTVQEKEDIVQKQNEQLKELTKTLMDMQAKESKGWGLFSTRSRAKSSR
eukprot:TRINITY_DN47434_c0_g1_i1.p1 TRINITY_DN47434_c0_g1~~TRINITY_DN47434_c0_g1_i1.p1  ORF type:complete len:249 (+),score=32.35 TRINITY_DN47434_c0_g1_i1:82-828(+)